MVENNKQVNIVILSGGLRKNSCTTGLLRAAVKNAPFGVKFTVVDISGLPIYN